MTDQHARLPPETVLAEMTWLRALVRRLVRDAHAADDVIQDTWVAHLREDPRDLEGPRLRAWLAMVARNFAWRRHRDNVLRRQHEEAAGKERAHAEGEEVELLRQQRAIADLVLDLREPYRSAVLLRFQKGLSYASIARRQGVSQEAARQRVSRGIAKLRARLDQVPDGSRGWRSVWIGWLRAEPPAGTLGTALGVPLMSSKLKVVVAGIAVLCGLFWFVSSRMTPGPGPGVRPAGAEGMLTMDGHPPREAPQDAAVERVPVELASWVVDRERDLHGVVVDPKGVPVAGAAIRAHLSHRSDPRTPFPTGDREIRPVLGATESDREGRFAIPLAAGRLHDLEVQAAGFARSWSLGHQAGERVVIQLQEGATLVGRVVLESNGAGVPDALIRIGPHGPFESGPRFAVATSRTSASGSFRFAGLGPEPMAISVETNAGGVPAGIPVELHAGQVTTVEVPVLPSRSIRGRVTDAKTGLPISGAEISVRLSGLTEGVCQTAEDGKYLLDVVPAREMIGNQWGRTPMLRVSAPHRVTFEQLLRLSPPETSVETIDVELVRGSAILGRVLGKNRVPFAGAEVTVVTLTNRYSGGGRFQKRPVKTDAKGRFEVDGLSTDLRGGMSPRDREAHVLWVQAEGLAPVVLELPLRAKPGERLDVGDIELSQPAIVRGEVVDDHGRPVAGANVGVVFEGEGRMRLWKPGAPPFAYGPSITVRTDDLGRFAVSGLPAGKVVVTARRFTIHRQVEEALTLAAGEERRGLRLVLPGGESIAGSVQTAGGEPVAGAIVYIRGGGGGASVETGAAGRFRADGLAPGSYTVNGSVKRIYGRPVSHLNDLVTGVLAGSEDITLTVHPAVEATGVVLGPGDEPVARRELKFTSPDYWRSISVYTGEEGRFRARLPEGIAFDLVVKPPTGSGGPSVMAMSGVRGGDEGLVVRVP